jgi:RNA polymerase sigma factor (sigma-70 family)
MSEGNTELASLVGQWFRGIPVDPLLERAIVAAIGVVASRAARARNVPAADVDDVVQETCAKFFEVVRRMPGPPENPEGLVWRMAQNLALDLHRRHQRGAQRDERFRGEAGTAAEEAVGAESQWLSEERQRWLTEEVRAGLERAPESYRSALRRHYLEGVPIEQIAEGKYREMVAAGTVDERDPAAVHAARRKARNLIDQHLRRGRDWLRLNEESR